MKYCLKRELNPVASNLRPQKLEIRRFLTDTVQNIQFRGHFNLLTPRNENFASHPKAYLKALLRALITGKLEKISI
jgi:hypothetical protein